MKITFQPFSWFRRKPKPIAFFQWLGPGYDFYLIGADRFFPFPEGWYGVRLT